VWHRLRHARNARRSRHDERGTVTLLMTVMLGVLMVSSAFVVDLGMQRVARADMQALADVVALDLSRELDGRTVDQLTPVLEQKAEESVARNSGMIGDTPVVDFDLGTLDDDGDFDAMANGVPTAVSVSAATEVAFAFAGVTGVDEGAAAREAAAMSASNACFRLGSFAAALRTGDSLVGDVFEALFKDDDALAVNLKAVGYDGLLNSYIDLEALAVEMGVGTVQALVDTGAISVKSLLEAGVRVLYADGNSDASAILDKIASAVKTDVQARVGHILAVGDGSAVSSRINTVDLIGGAGLAAALNSSVADHNNLLSVGVPWNVAHTSQGDIELQVIEPPRQACGAPNDGTTASTGQVRLDADLGFNLPNRILGLDVRSTVNPTSKSASIAVRAEVAGAQAELTGLSCDGGVEEFRMRVDSRLTDISVTLPFAMSGSLDAAALEMILPPHLIPNVAKKLLSLDLELRLSSAVQLQTVARTDYTDPEPSAGAAELVEIGAPVVSVAATSRVWLNVAGLRTELDLELLDLSSILSAVSSSVIGTSLPEVVTNFNDALLPLAKLLGLRVAGADVYGVPGPMCNLPRLVG
jgi:Flp pilus assembly protein TadG